MTNPAIKAPHLLLKSIKFHALRIVIILIISLIIVHLLSLHQLPFTKNYNFPFTAFGIASMFGLVLCSLNWVVYKKVPVPAGMSNHKKLLHRLYIHAVSTTIFYTIIYWLIIIEGFNNPFNGAHYLKYYVICMTVIILEFLIVELWRQHQTGMNSQAVVSQLVVPTMTKDLRLSMTDILMFSSLNGVVKLYLNNHKPLITKYSSLDELECRLPEVHFFRVNRQYLISRDIIREVKRNTNRTLQLGLSLNGNGQQEEVNISRYKRKAFMEWFNGAS